MTGGNIAAEFHAAAIGRLDAPFLLDGQRSWTYGEFFDQVRVYAAVLINAGAQPGDRVLVHVEKSPEAVALYLRASGQAPCTCRTTTHSPPTNVATSSPTPNQRSSLSIRR